MAERVLDQTLIDEEAERAVLGVVLSQPAYIARLLNVVQDDDFGIQKHRDLWRIMRETFEAGDPPDFVFVGRGMRRLGLERFAPEYESYLSEVFNAAPFTCYGLHYAEVVADVAERRRFVEAMQQSVNAVYAGDSDPDELAEQTARSLQAVARVRQRGTYKHIADVEDDVYGPPVTHLYVGGAFELVDHIIGGFEAGQLIAVGARPGVGKSAAMLQILWEISSRQGYPTGIVSLEMGSRSLRSRLLGHVAHVNIAATRRERRQFTPEERRRLDAARERIDTTPIFVDENPRRVLGDVVARIRAMRLEQRVELVGLDYLQLLADNAKSENRTQEMTRISGAMKQLAMELQIPIVCLAQFSRGMMQRTNPRPQLSDFRDSGSIEQDADIALLMYPDERFKGRLLERQLCQQTDTFIAIDVAKNRNGATGRVVLEYVGQHTAFMNLRPEQMGVRYDD